MSASNRVFVPPAHERGVIAILTAQMMLVLIVFALTVFSLASLTIEKRKAQNAVDAVALELADEMILKPNTSWGNLSPAVNYLLTHNGQSGSGGFAPPALSTPIYNRGFGGTSNSAGAAGQTSLRDVWMPASVQVHATVTPTTPIQKVLTQLSSMLPSSGGGSAQTQLGVDANARVAQIQLSSFTVSRARAMLLFDFSPSMRLSYKGHEGDFNYSGISTVRYAAMQLMTWMVQQYNFSVRVFGYETRLLASAITYKQTLQPPFWSQVMSYNAASFDKLNNAPSVGDQTHNGTDMITPIDDAVGELLLNDDQLAGAPIFILVSDGEPSQSGPTPCTGTLIDCNKAAAEATQARMNYWFGQKLNGANIESFSFLINRDNQNLQDKDQTFMKQMAGDQNHMPAGNANNYMLDEYTGGESYMQNFMKSLPIKDYCMSEDIGAFLSGSRKPDDIAYPRAGEAIQGYYTFGNSDLTNDAHSDVYQATQVMSFDEFFAPLSAYPRVDPSDPTHVDGTIVPVDEVLKHPENGLARFFYEPTSRRVWLNPWLCMNMTFYQDGQKPSPARFRMRWGRPVMATSDADPLTTHEGF